MKQKQPVPPVASSGRNQAIEQDHFFFCGGKIVRCSFGNVADHSRLKSDGAVAYTQAPAALQNLADHVFIGMLDLPGVRFSSEFEGNQAGGEAVTFQAGLVAYLAIDRLELLQRGLQLDDFHVG